MIVKSHKRKRRNGVTIVRSHNRKSAIVNSHFSPDRFSYDKGARELTIRFPFGARYTYHDVPPSIEKRIAADPKAALSYVKKTFVYSPDSKKADAIFNQAQKNRAAKAKIKPAAKVGSIKKVTSKTKVR